MRVWLWQCDNGWATRQWMLFSICTVFWYPNGVMEERPMIYLGLVAADYSVDVYAYPPIDVETIILIWGQLIHIFMTQITMTLPAIQWVWAGVSHLLQHTTKLWLLVRRGDLLHRIRIPRSIDGLGCLHCVPFYHSGGCQHAEEKEGLTYWCWFWRPLTLVDISSLHVCWPCPSHAVLLCITCYHRFLGSEYLSVNSRRTFAH